MELALEILIPGGTIRLTGLKSVVFQSTEGEVGVLPGHLPMIALLESGELRAESRDGVKRFAAGTGVVRIAADRVSVLVHDLVAEDEIDAEMVRESLDASRKVLAAANLSGIEAYREDLLRDIRFAEAQLSLLDR